MSVGVDGSLPYSEIWKFPLPVICLFLEVEAVPGTDAGVLDTGDPERFWNGDPEIRILPGARRKMIPKYFSPTPLVFFLQSSFLW